MSVEVTRAVIDSLEFARTGQTLRGRLALSSLTRLQDSLYDTLGQVDFVVQGTLDGRQRPALILEVDGVLHLACQRCLDRFDYPVRLRSTLLLGDAPEAEDEAEDDWIEPSGELDVAGLVEDEIILGLPYSPRHPDGACGTESVGGSKRTGGQAFARLAALKQDTN